PDLFVRYREVLDAATHPTPAKPWIWDQALAVSKPVVPPPSKARSSKSKAVAKESTRTKHDAVSSSKAKKQDPPSSDKIDKKDDLMQRFEADLTEACLKADRMYEEAKALQESLPVPAPVRAPSATPIAAPVVAATLAPAPTPAQVPADLAAAFLAAFPVLAVAPTPAPVPAATVSREAGQTIVTVDVPAKDINLDQLLQAELASAFQEIGDMQPEETSSFPSSTASTDLASLLSSTPIETSTSVPDENEEEDEDTIEEQDEQDDIPDIPDEGSTLLTSTTPTSPTLAYVSDFANNAFRSFAGAAGGMFDAVNAAVSATGVVGSLVVPGAPPATGLSLPTAGDAGSGAVGRGRAVGNLGNVQFPIFVHSPLL
ncbi:hypothetical protein BKA70DRAFT_1308853, partial [Coprinopsis sp. MPI-PUGE-AT-0042]